MLVDGFERPFNEINIEDIDHSLYWRCLCYCYLWCRGANGVIITAKRWWCRKININGKVEYGYNTRTRTPEFVDGITYAQLLNEARRTRTLNHSTTTLKWVLSRIISDPDLYPNVSWKDILLKTEQTHIGHRSTWAEEVLQPAILCQWLYEWRGMYKTDEMLKDYNTNSNLERYNYRMNTDNDITPSTILRTVYQISWKTKSCRLVPSIYCLWEYWRSGNDHQNCKCWRY